MPICQDANLRFTRCLDLPWKMLIWSNQSTDFSRSRDSWNWMSMFVSQMPLDPQFWFGATKPSSKFPLSWANHDSEPRGLGCSRRMSKTICWLSWTSGRMGEMDENMMVCIYIYDGKRWSESNWNMDLKGKTKKWWRWCSPWTCWRGGGVVRKWDVHAFMLH